MKYLFGLLLIAALAYGAWPYVHLYRLDRALIEDNRAELRALVDLEAIKTQRQTALEWRAEAAVGTQGGLAEMIRNGARWLGETTAERVVSIEWVRETLRSLDDTANGAYPPLFPRITFAFFESPSTFLVRIRDLGQDPVHLRMKREGWNWKVKAIFE